MQLKGFFKDDMDLMRRAILQARLAEARGEVPVGAVMVSGDGMIISEAFNSPIALCDPTAHAEILAIRKAASTVDNYRLTGTTIYVTLEPCPMCAGALVWARVDRLIFGARDPKAGAFGSVMDMASVSSLNHRIQVYSGLLADECAGLLQGFFRERR